MLAIRLAAYSILVRAYGEILGGMTETPQLGGGLTTWSICSRLRTGYAGGCRFADTAFALGAGDGLGHTGLASSIFHTAVGRAPGERL